MVADLTTIQKARRPQLSQLEYGSAIHGNRYRPSTPTWRLSVIVPPQVVATYPLCFLSGQNQASGCFRWASYEQVGICTLALRRSTYVFMQLLHYDYRPRQPVYVSPLLIITC